MKQYNSSKHQRNIKSKQRTSDKLLTNNTAYEYQWNTKLRTDSHTDNEISGMVEDHFICDDEDYYFELINESFEHYTWEKLHKDMNIFYGHNNEYTFNHSQSDMNTFDGQCCFWYFVWDRLHITNELMYGRYLNMFEADTCDPNKEKYNYLRLIDSLNISNEYLFYILNEIDTIALAEFNYSYSRSKPLIMNKDHLISVLDKYNSVNIGVEICKIIASFAVRYENSVMYHYQRSYDFKNSSALCKFEGYRRDLLCSNIDHRIINHSCKGNSVKILDGRDMNPSYANMQKKCHKTFSQRRAAIDRYNDILKLVWHKFKLYIVCKIQNDHEINAWMLVIILIYYVDNSDIILPKCGKYIHEITPRKIEENANLCIICGCYYGEGSYSKYQHENGRKHKQNVLRKQSWIITQSEDTNIWNEIYHKNKCVRSSSLLQDVLLNISAAMRMQKCVPQHLLPCLKMKLIQKVAGNSNDLKEFCECIKHNYYISHTFIDFWDQIWRAISCIPKLHCIEMKSLQILYELTCHYCFRDMEQKINKTNNVNGYPFFVGQSMIHTLLNNMNHLSSDRLKVFLDLLQHKYGNDYSIDSMEMAKEFNQMYCSDGKNIFRNNAALATHVIKHINLLTELTSLLRTESIYRTYQQM